MYLLNPVQRFSKGLRLLIFPYLTPPVAYFFIITSLLCSSFFLWSDTADSGHITLYTLIHLKFFTYTFCVGALVLWFCPVEAQK